MAFKLNVLLGFRPEIASLNRTAEQIRNTLNRSKISGSPLPPSFKRDVDSFNNSLKQTQKEIALTSTRMERLGALSALALRRFSAFSLATGAVFGFTRAVTQGIRDGIAFQRQLVRIAQIGNDTAAGLDLLTDNITRLSKAFGANANELVNISVIIAQTGRTARETRQILDAVAESSLAPTFGDMESTTEGLIAALTQFNIQASQSKEVLGSINQVAARFPVEADDIISAVRRAGATFAAASNPFDTGTEKLQKFIATFSAIRGTTRESAETVATGLRTILTRFQRASTINRLQEFGVEGLLDSEGRFIGAFEAINKLSSALGNLASKGPSPELSGILEELGGFRQINKTIPLITGLQKRMDALKEAQQGQNSISEDSEKAQEALQVQFAKTREEFSALIREFALSNGFKTFVNEVLSLTNGLIKLVNTLEPAIPLLLTLGSLRLAGGTFNFLRGFRTESRNPGLLGGGRQVGGFLPFATGGRVPGAGNRDSVPSMLMPGEVVINKKAVAKFGAKNLLALNRSAGGSDAPTVRDGIQFFVRGGIAGNNSGLRRKIIEESGATGAEKKAIEQAVLKRFKGLSDSVGPTEANRILNQELKSVRGQGVQGILSGFRPKSTALAVIPGQGVTSGSRQFNLVKEPQKLLTGPPRKQSPLLLPAPTSKTNAGGEFVTTDRRGNEVRTKVPGGIGIKQSGVARPVTPQPSKPKTRPPRFPLPQVVNRPQPIDPNTLTPLPVQPGLGFADENTLAPEPVADRATRAAQARTTQTQAVNKLQQIQAARAAGLTPLEIQQRLRSGQSLSVSKPPVFSSTRVAQGADAFFATPTRENGLLVDDFVAPVQSTGQTADVETQRKQFQKEERRRLRRESIGRRFNAVKSFAGRQIDRVTGFGPQLSPEQQERKDKIRARTQLAGFAALTSAGLLESGLRGSVKSPGGAAALGGTTGGLVGFGVGAQIGGPAGAVLGGLVGSFKGAIDGFQNEIEKVNTEKLVASIDNLDKALSKKGLSGSADEINQAFQAAQESVSGVARRGGRFGSVTGVSAGFGGLGTGPGFKFGISERNFLSQDIGALERIKLDADAAVGFLSGGFFGGADRTAQREIQARRKIEKEQAGNVQQAFLEQSESILDNVANQIKAGRTVRNIPSNALKAVGLGLQGPEADSIRNLLATGQADIQSGNAEQIKTGRKEIERALKEAEKLGKAELDRLQKELDAQKKLFDAFSLSKVEVDNLAERMRDFAAVAREAANAGAEINNRIENIRTGTFSPLDRTNTFNNTRAFSRERIEGQVGLLERNFGPLGSAASIALGGKDIETRLRNRFKDIAELPPAAAEDQKTQLLNIISQEFGDLPKVIRDNIAARLEQVFSADQGGKSLLQFVQEENFAELIAGDLRDSATQGLAQLLENLNAINRDYATGLKQVLDDQLEIDRRRLDVSQQGAEFAIDRARLFGRELSISELTNPTTNRVKALTGGLTTSGGIVNELSFLKEQRDRLTEASRNAGTIDEERRIADALIANEKATRNNEEALDILANRTDQLTAVQDKIRSLQEREQSRRSLIERLATAGPEDILQINREIAAARAGLANGFGGLSGQQRAGALNILGQVAPAALTPEQAKQFQDTVLQSITGQVFPGLIQGFGPGVQKNLFDLTGSQKLESALIEAEENIINARNAQINLDQVKIDAVSVLIGERLEEQVGANQNAARVGRNSGGLIPGRGPNRDSVPAYLTKGEFVVNRDATDQNLDLLMAINNGYTDGGRVVSPEERNRRRLDRAAGQMAARKARLRSRGISTISPASQTRRDRAEAVRIRTAERRANIRRLIRTEQEDRKNRGITNRGTINGIATEDVLAQSDARAGFLRRTQTGIINGKVYVPGTFSNRHIADNLFTRDRHEVIPGGLINGKPTAEVVKGPNFGGISEKTYRDVRRGYMDNPNRPTHPIYYNDKTVETYSRGLINGRPTTEVLGPKRRYNSGGQVGGQSRGGGLTRSMGEFSAASEKLTRSIDPFVQAINQFSSVLSNLGSIPSKIEMTGRHEVNVVINGAEVLANMKEPLRGLVMEEINKNIKRYINPVDGSTNESVFPISNGRTV